MKTDTCPKKQLFAWSVLAICITLYCVGQFAYSIPVVQRRPAATENKIIPVDPITRSNKTDMSDSSTEILKIACENPKKPMLLEAKASLVRIELENCPKNFVFYSGKGTNETNHYSVQFLATPKSKKIMSNFFQVDSGINLINFEISGTKHEIISQKISISKK